jgi:hypothetical protein
VLLLEIFCNVLQGNAKKNVGPLRCFQNIRKQEKGMAEETV